jgi:hypothetical protein
MLERKLLERGIGNDCGKDGAVTFVVHASRGEEVMTTFRLSAVIAVAKGLALAGHGWQVFITDPNDNRYYPAEFNRLLSSKPAVYSHK